MKNTRGRNQPRSPPKPFVVALLAFAALAGAIAQTPPRQKAPLAARSGSRVRLMSVDTIADVAETARASVVHIDTSGSMIQQLPIYGPYGFHAPQDSSATILVHGLGSGIILDVEGRILTNYHVVENVDSITVQFFDGTKLSARLLGSDPTTDLAVIKVDGRIGGPPVRFGDSDAMRVGDWVIAIGSPEGLDWSVTMGIISAKHRGSVGGAEPTGLEDYIQTDAAINPGNSGGPLLNLSGEVIGINSLILSKNSGSEGIGFAIPTAITRSISDSLIKQGKVVRGDLGLRFQDLSPVIAAGLKLPESMTGIVVVEVIPEGPADVAGLKQGDVIVRYQGSAVPSSLDLKRAIAATKPGESAKLDILRDGKPKSIDATVDDQYQLQTRVALRPGYKILGIVVRSLEDGEAESLGLLRNSGVFVTQVVPGSPADQANVNVGDVIFMVGSSDVTDPAQFTARIGDAAKSGSALLLIHDASTGMVGYLNIPLKR